MKTIFSVLLFVCFFNSAVKSNIAYLDPLPGAKYVSIYNNVILGSDKNISPNNLSSVRINVAGSKSGLHTGSIILSGNTIIFKPDNPFALNENVTVSLGSGFTLFSRNNKHTLSYSFNTELQRVAWDSERSMREETAGFSGPPQYTSPVLPNLDVTVSNNPAPGKIFIANYPYGDPFYKIISDNTGLPYYYSLTPGGAVDLKVQDNGHITFMSVGAGKFFEMNPDYTVVDSFHCGNGYTTDIHELKLLENRHALLFSYDPKIVDMSGIIMGGQPNATVVGLIIQELDENKNVVFQWRSWDHFEITDATKEDMTAGYIDYVHGNAIEVDIDGNLLLSSRHMDEITKINRATGDIIWRLGGKHNQFTFVNDSLQFSHQHAIRKLSNGNITLFDNGNFHTPQFSRAVEYTINEPSRTAVLVWQYRHTPDIYSMAMGYVQRLSNGNTFIGWGWATPSVTEVTPDGQISFEASFPAGIYSYRAYKFDWGIATNLINTGAGVSNFQLSQNFPNPFNPVTSIRFSIPGSNEGKPENVTLKIYDITGKIVDILIDRQLKEGSYSVTWDGSRYASGVYYYTLQAGSFSETKKMLLIK